MDECKPLVCGVCRRAELGGDGGEGRGGGTPRPPSPMTSPVKANGVDFDPKADGFDFSPIRAGFVAGAYTRQLLAQLERLLWHTGCA